MLCGLNVCTPEEEAKCREEIPSEKYQRWACDHCPKRKSREIHPWTSHILGLRRLMKAGYPFEKKDLSYQEWLDLGLANELIESKTRIF